MAIDETPPSATFGPVTVYFGEKNGKYPDGNQVIVQGADRRIAFDTPQVANRIGAHFDGVDGVILGHVHEDHLAGLHRLPGVPVEVHHADLAAAQSWEGLSRHYGYAPEVLAEMRPRIERDFHYRPRPDATPYDDGATWDLGGGVQVQALHYPGHTAGHCVLRVEPVGVAFIGDFDLSSFGPYYGDATSNLGDFRRSLARLRAMPAAVWITSHHRGAYTDRAAFLDALDSFTARLAERETKLLLMLGDTPRTLDQLIAQRLLYAPDHDSPWVLNAERRTIGQHLAELVGQGRVAQDGDAFRRLS